MSVKRVIVVIDKDEDPADVFYVTAIDPGKSVAYKDDARLALVFARDVIYDRIRELRKHYPHMAFAAMLKP